MFSLTQSSFVRGTAQVSSSSGASFLAASRHFFFFRILSGCGVRVGGSFQVPPLFARSFFSGKMEFVVFWWRRMHPKTLECGVKSIRARVSCVYRAVSRSRSVFFGAFFRIFFCSRLGLGGVLKPENPLTSSLFSHTYARQQSAPRPLRAVNLA